MIAKIQQFSSEVIAEIKRVSWPSRKEVIDATWIVLLTAIALGILVGLTDFLLSNILRWIIK